MEQYSGDLVYLNILEQIMRYTPDYNQNGCFISVIITNQPNAQHSYGTFIYYPSNSPFSDNGFAACIVNNSFRNNYTEIKNGVCVHRFDKVCDCCVTVVVYDYLSDKIVVSSSIADNDIVCDTIEHALKQLSLTRIGAKYLWFQNNRSLLLLTVVKVTTDVVVLQWDVYCKLLCKDEPTSGTFEWKFDFFVGQKLLEYEELVGVECNICGGDGFYFSSDLEVLGCFSCSVISDLMKRSLVMSW